MIDWFKPIKRQDKIKVKFVMEVNHPTHPIAVLVHYPGGDAISMYRRDGHLYREDNPSGADIENEVEYQWINIYPTYCGKGYDTIEDAEKHALPYRIGRKKIKLEKGWDC